MELKMYFENNNEIIEMPLPKIETEISDFKDGLCSVKNSIKGMQEMTALLLLERYRVFKKGKQ